MAGLQLLPLQIRRIWRTLRFRLAAWNALVVLLIALVLLISVRQGVRWALFHEIDQLLLEEIREISLNIQDTEADEFSLLIEDLARKAQGHQRNGWFAELLDEHGHILWASADALKGSLTPPAAKNLAPYTFDNRRIIEMRIAKGPLGITKIRIGAGLDFINQDIARIDRLMFMAVAALILIAPACGYWLAGRAARTVGDIIHTAGRLRPSHLEERLKLRGTGDELDQLAHTINGLLDRIAAYLEQKRDFLANAAHELRTPLAAIRSSIEVSLNGDRSPGEYADVLEDIIDQTSALEAMVNQLLLLSETETETDVGRGAEELVSLDNVVSRAVDMFQGAAENKNLNLTLHCHPDVRIHGNRYHLRQVLNNLLDNAIKYTPPGGDIVVRLQVEPEQQQARLTISDTGIGIPASDVPHVFERFFRADRSRSRSLAIQGTGLGLSICEAVIHTHGGTITCHSKLGQGTTIEVVLPLDEESGAGNRNHS